MTAGQGPVEWQNVRQARVSTEMSYTIAICVPPVPESDEAAWKELDGLIEQQGEVPAEFRTLIADLTSRYPCICDLPNDKIDDGVWSDGPLRNNAGHKATVLGLAFSRADEVLPFVVATANRLGLVVFDWQTNRIHRADGLAGIRMTVENEPVFVCPSVRRIHESIVRMTPNGGPGFVIVERVNRDYVQAAGGDGSFTAEWREYVPDGFRHFKAGIQGQATEPKITIKTNGYTITVHGNERLSANDVKAVFTAFAEGKHKPDSFVWRDMTDMFS